MIQHILLQSNRLQKQKTFLHFQWYNNAELNIRSKALAFLYGHEPVTNQVEWPDGLKHRYKFSVTDCVEGSTLDGGT